MNKIIEGCDTISKTPGIFEKASRSKRRKTEACMELGRGYFHNFL